MTINCWAVCAITIRLKCPVIYFLYLPFLYVEERLVFTFLVYKFTIKPNVVKHVLNNLINLKLIKIELTIILIQFALPILFIENICL